MNINDNIYIAGHRGLIGSSMLRQLKLLGFKNIITADKSTLDLTNYNSVLKFFKETKPEYIILAAGKVGGIIENSNYPGDFLYTNTLIQMNVINASKIIGIKKLIFFASSCMYPVNINQPMTEDKLWSGKPELTSLSYATAKLSGMQMCLSYNFQLNAQIFIPVIPNSAYGPNDNFDLKSAHVLAALINKIHKAKITDCNKIEIWGTGKPLREFVYVDDITLACIHILKKDDLVKLSLPINIGSGHEISIFDLAKMISKIIGFSGDIKINKNKPDGAMRKLLDSSKIKNLGWKPKTSLETGIINTYKWYLNQYRDNIC